MALVVDVTIVAFFFRAVVVGDSFLVIHGIGLGEDDDNLPLGVDTPIDTPIDTP